MNSPTQSMSFLEPTLGHAARVWWAFVWRALLLSIVVGFSIGFLVGFLIGIVGHMLGFDPVTVASFAVLMGLVVGIPLGTVIGIYVMRSILRKDFPTFGIRLVAR